MVLGVFTFRNIVMFIPADLLKYNLKNDCDRWNETNAKSKIQNPKSKMILAND
jgi:hypothetical protein